jgi:hypothetical protein
LRRSIDNSRMRRRADCFLLCSADSSQVHGPCSIISMTAIASATVTARHVPMAFRLASAIKRHFRILIGDADAALQVTGMLIMRFIAATQMATSPPALTQALRKILLRRPHDLLIDSLPTAVDACLRQAKLHVGVTLPFLQIGRRDVAFLALACGRGGRRGGGRRRTGGARRRRRRFFVNARRSSATNSDAARIVAGLFARLFPTRLHCIDLSL